MKKRHTASNRAGRNPQQPARTDGKQFDRHRQETELQFLFANDGYFNQTACIGEASPLVTAGTFVRSDLLLDEELLTTAYRVNWIARRIVDMPAEDMTRAWYTLSTAVSEANLAKLRRLEAAHSVKQEMTNAIRWARLYGGSIAVMVLRDEEDRLELPLDPDILLPDCFQGLLVLDRTQAGPSEETVADLDDPDFGEPAYYTVQLEHPLEGIDPEEELNPVTGMPRIRPTEIRIHHSRVLRFVGPELPWRESIREQRWGASALEPLWDELLKRCNASANIAQLIFQANITALKLNDVTDMLAVGTDEKREKAFQTMEFDNYFRTSFGVQLLNKDDSMENLSYSFAGLAEVYELFMLDMAGAAGIPATKLYGRSPQGMNATGESDLRNYYEMITSQQEQMLRPALEKLLPVMAISCWGFAPENMDILFEPVMTLSAEDQVKVAGDHCRLVLEAFQAGAITREEVREELNRMSKRTGIMSGIGGKKDGKEKQH